MLPNIQNSVYTRFKSDPTFTGYRLKRFMNTPVTNINSIVHLAYLDVCRTIYGIRFPQAQELKSHAHALVTTVISRSHLTQSQFDKRHQECCEAIINTTGTPVYYGQAQKLVNMSLKYLYNEHAVYFPGANHLNYPTNNVEWLFHIPVDNQIVNFLVSQHTFARPREAWSRWNRDHYISFQNQLRNRLVGGYLPLEIDYLIWNSDALALHDSIQ